MPGYFRKNNFKNYDRVKKLGIIINSKEYTMKCIDKMEEQFYEFDKPIKFSEITFIIRDAFKYLSYFDNIAISEVAFFYEDKKINIDLNKYSKYLDSNITYVNIEYNDGSEIIQTRLPSDLKRLSVGGLKAFVDDIKGAEKLNDLEELSLYFTNNPFAEKIYFPNLKKLFLGYISIYNEYDLEFIEQNYHVRELILNDVDINIELLTNFKNLEKLYISDFKFFGKEIDFTVNKSLKFLAIKDNRVSIDSNFGNELNLKLPDNLKILLLDIYDEININTNLLNKFKEIQQVFVCKEIYNKYSDFFSQYKNISQNFSELGEEYSVFIDINNSANDPAYFIPY